MKLQEMVFYKYKPKQTATVLILSCIMLAGCSWNGAQSNQPEQMNSNHKDFVNLEKKYMQILVFMPLIPVQVKRWLIKLMSDLLIHQL